MNKHTRKSYIKVAYAIMVVASISSLVAAILAYKYQLQSEREQAYSYLEQIALSVESAASTAAYIDNEPLAQEIVDGLAVIDIVSAARMTSTNDMVVSSPGFEEQEDSISLTLSAPFYDEEVGALLISADAERIRKSAEMEAMKAAVSLIMYSVVLSAFVAWLVYIMLSKPLKSLNESFQKVDPSDPLPLPLLKHHENDEIGSVTRGINQLLGEIDFHLEKERSLRAETEKLERKFRLIFERASAGIAIIDPDNRVITQNPSFLNMLQAEPDISFPFPELFDNVDEVTAKLEHVRESARFENDTVNLKYITREKETVWLHALISKVADQRESRRPNGGPLLEIIVYDITHLIEREEQTRFEADHDSLTHLNNRRAGERKLAEMIERCCAEGVHLVYLMIDLDKFKPVNDNFGHEAGDIVLQEVANRMKQVFNSPDDVCIRWGGDEFTAARIVKEYSKAETGDLASRLHGLLCEPVSLQGGKECTVGASIGIVIAPEHGTNFDELKSNADHMMYYVKAHGRNNYKIFNAE